MKTPITLSDFSGFWRKNAKKFFINALYMSKRTFTVEMLLGKNYQSVVLFGLYEKSFRYGCQNCTLFLQRTILI